MKAKSKYAVTQPKNALKVGDESGVQTGRTPPAKRKYGRAKYKAVTLGEAMSNMQARQEGNMPPIKNGLDFDELPEEVSNQMRLPEGKKAQAVQRARQVEEDAEIDKGKSFDPFAGQDEDPQNQIVDDRPVNMVPVERVLKNERPGADAFGIAHKANIAVTLEMEAGSMSLQVEEVLQCKYALTLVLPLKTENAMFIPKPGSEIVVGFNETQVRCFFPGAHFTSERLGVMFLVFIKAES